MDLGTRGRPCNQSPEDAEGGLNRLIQGRDLMLGHVLQFGVQKVYELFTTYTPFSSTELPSEEKQYGRYSGPPHTRS